MKNICTCQICELMEDEMEGLELDRNGIKRLFIRTFFYILLILTLSFFIIKGCGDTAIADDSYSYEEARWAKSLKELHPDEKVRKEVPVVVDRKVLSKADYEADPEVLISSPKAISMREVEEKIVVVKEPVYVVEKPEEGIKITSWYEED